VFTGGIDRAQDLDGDTVVDQDRDAWEFEGRAGDYLSLRVLSLGLAGPAFLVDGPRGYHRESTIGVESAPRRELLLPYDGRYTIVIVPGSFVATGVPVGSIDARYVGVLERKALPSASTTAGVIVPGGSASSPMQMSGALFGLDDNFFQLVVQPRTAVQVTFRAVGAEVAPAAIVMARALDAPAGPLTQLAHVQQIEEGGWIGAFIPDDVEAFLVVDWRSAHGAADDFTIDVHEVPLAVGGLLPLDNNVDLDAQDLPGHETAAWQLAVDTAQIVSIDVDGSFAPDVQIVGPTGTLATIADEDEMFFYALPGEYVVFVNNDATGDDEDVTLGLSLLTPADLGDLVVPSDAGGAPSHATMTGRNLHDTRGGPSQAWGIVHVTPASLLALSLHARAGDPQLLVFADDATPVRGVKRAHTRTALHVASTDARTLLVRVDATAGTNELDNVIDWHLDAALTALPSVVEVEPNDTHDRATILGTLESTTQAPITVRGRLGAKQTDLYLVDLADALDATHALRVSFDDLGQTGASGTVSAGTSVMIYDEQRQPLASLPFDTATVYVNGEQVEMREGTLGPNTQTFVASSEGQGPFFIELAKIFDTTDGEYVLTVDVVERQSESEPNDDAPHATSLALPASVVGWRSATDTADLYRVQLAADGAPGSALVVEWDNLETNNDLIVALELDDGSDGVAPLATQTRVLGALHAPALAGSYLVRVTGAGALEPAYHLRVRVEDDVESEPNDEAASANALGVLGAAAGSALVVQGEASDVDTDVFTFTLAAPLVAGTGLAIEALNASDTSNVTIELWSGAAGTGALLAANTFDAALIACAPAGTGPFSLVVRGASAPADRYFVRIARGGDAESEPNDTQEDATVIDALPVSLEANLRAGDTDVYRLDIAQDTTVNAAFANLTDTTSLRISLRLANFDTEFGSVATDDGRLAGIFLPAGTYFLVITPVSPNATGDHYRLIAEEAP
jgi:hypothetical protein